MDKNSLKYQLYTLDNDNEVKVLVNEGSIWLSRKSIGELFDCPPGDVSAHLKSAFESGELYEAEVSQDLPIAQQEGAQNSARTMKFYNLEAILLIGYRASSLKATRFRQWVTKIMREYMVKGFLLDASRLKQGENVFGEEYSKELLDRIHSIRASDRHVYLQLTDAFAEICVDYEKDSPVAKEFYSVMLNKFHYAITGQTMAETVRNKSDSTSDNMGLSTWKNAPDGRVLKSDATVARNYLSKQEIQRLEVAVSGFFDYVQELVSGGVLIKMEAFADIVDKFLASKRYNVLLHGTKTSNKEAREKAHQEYKKFNKTQRVNSDFEKEIAKIIGKS